jgi:hypothetical protein
MNKMNPNAFLGTVPLMRVSRGLNPNDYRSEISLSLTFAEENTHIVDEIAKGLDARVRCRIDQLGKEEKVDLRIGKTLSHLCPVKLGVLFSVGTSLALDCSCVHYLLLLFREPRDLSGCSEEEKANYANDNCKSAQEERDSVS